MRNSLRLVKLPLLLLLLMHLLWRHRRVMEPLLLLLRRRSLRLGRRRRVPSGPCGLGGLCGRRGRGVSDRREVSEVRVEPRLVGGRGVEPSGAVGLGDGADEAVVVLEELLKERRGREREVFFF